MVPSAGGDRWNVLRHALRPQGFTLTRRHVAAAGRTPAPTGLFYGAEGHLLGPTQMLLSRVLLREHIPPVPSALVSTRHPQPAGTLRLMAADLRTMIRPKWLQAGPALVFGLGSWTRIRYTVESPHGQGVRPEGSPGLKPFSLWEGASSFFRSSCQGLWWSAY